MIDQWVKRKVNQHKLEAVLESHYANLYRIAYAWTQDASLAQDLVQETMLKSLQKAEQLRSFEHADRWLCKIMHNLFYDNCRQNSQWQSVAVEDAEQHLQVESVESLFVRKQTIDDVHHAIGCLPLEQREVLIFVDLQGYSYDEVASIAEVPVGTVMSRLSRARAKLRSLMTSENSPSSYVNNVVALTKGKQK